jgi:hypothetical protein
MDRWSKLEEIPNNTMPLRRQERLIASRLSGPASSAAKSSLLYSLKIGLILSCN